MKLLDIYTQAVDNDLCKPWQEKMRKDLSLKNLCEMYFNGDDWSMEKDFPNLETLRNFKGITDSYGLFTDYKGSLKNYSKSAFFGVSDVIVEFDKFTVSQMIIRHQSKVKITAKDNAIVIINLLDDAELEIESIGNSRIEIYSYGNSNIKYIGDVRIHKTSFKK